MVGVIVCKLADLHADQWRAGRGARRRSLEATKSKPRLARWMSRNTCVSMAGKLQGA
jgi:hypothetical protein